MSIQGASGSIQGASGSIQGPSMSIQGAVRASFDKPLPKTSMLVLVVMTCSRLTEFRTAGTAGSAAGGCGSPLESRAWWKGAIQCYFSFF